MSIITKANSPLLGKITHSTPALWLVNRMTHRSSRATPHILLTVLTCNGLFWERTARRAVNRDAGNSCKGSRHKHISSNDEGTKIATPISIIIMIISLLMTRDKDGNRMSPINCAVSKRGSPVIYRVYRRRDECLSCGVWFTTRQQRITNQVSTEQHIYENDLGRLRK